jgi:vacuolar-type H+-ATPase subunit C/Vma6
MTATEIGVVARAKGLAGRLVPRQTLETLATVEKFEAFVQSLSRLGSAIDPIGEPADVFAVERAIARTASRHLWTLYRWQERTPGVVDVFAAHQDRRSLRALLRGAAGGASPEARARGLLPTALLPQGALTDLAHQPSPSAVVQRLFLLAHPDASRLLPLVETSPIDLLAVDEALLAGFANRACRIAVRADEALREFVRMLIDAGNAQNALLVAGEPVDVDRSTLFVHGGRWFPVDAFLAVTRAASFQQAVTVLTAAIAHSPLALSVPLVATDVADVDRTFVVTILQWLARASRLDPLSTAPLLRVLLLVEAQSRDLRTLAWGVALGTPPSLRTQQLVTPA